MDLKPEDFTIIGEVETGISIPAIQESELAGLEINSLEQGKLQHVSEMLRGEIEQLNHASEMQRGEIDLIHEHVKNFRQDTELRKNFSGQIIYYLWAFSAFCAAVLMIDGFNLWGFRLETPVLVTLVGGTAASAFGLVSVVLGGLFKHPPVRDSSRPINGPSSRV